MSVGPPSVDPGSEREIDLGRWRDAIRARLWFVIVGLVLGLVIGGLYSTKGASTYSATVTIEPAQPFGPDGQSVINYASSPLAIQLLVTATAAADYAAKVANMQPDKLAGNISTSSVLTNTGPVTQRGTVLIEITVTLPNEVEAAAAANALGTYIQSETESPYVRKSLAADKEIDAIYAADLNAVDKQLAAFQSTLNADQNLDPIDKLVIVSDYNDAIQRQGNYQTQLNTNEAAYILAQDIEVAQIISPAASSKVTSRSRRDSIAVGGVIGLLIGLIAALYLGLRPARPARAA